MGVLAQQEMDFDLELSDVLDFLDTELAGIVSFSNAPPGIGVGLVVAGSFDGERPILCSLGEWTGWKAKPSRCDAFMTPIDRRDEVTVREFTNAITIPGFSYLDKMKAAIGFCAGRYETVNRSYILRRFSAGFVREEGTL